MESICYEQSEWMRGAAAESPFGDHGKFSAELFTDTERANSEMLASINERGLLSFFGQMGECKDITDDRQTRAYYGENFLDFLNPVANYENMTDEEQQRVLSDSYRILDEEVVSMTLSEKYWIGGMAPALAVLYLQEQFKNNASVTVRSYPVGKYIWMCAHGKRDEAETKITNNHTTLTLKTKTKGEHTTSHVAIVSFPHQTVLQRIIVLLEGHPKVRKDLFSNWCFVMIEDQESCVNRSRDVLSALESYVGDIYPGGESMHGRSSKGLSSAARAARKLLH